MATHEPRFDYAGPYRTEQHAADELESMFAQGDVCEGERPQLEARKVRREGKLVTRWYISLAA